MRKTPKTNIDVSGRKIPKATAPHQTDFYTKCPVWSFLNIDISHAQWGASCNTQCLIRVIEGLRDLEWLTSWGEVFRLTSGRANNTRNHSISISELCRGAQKRLEELNLDDIDVLYSIALGGTLRVWGIMQDAILRIVWVDQHHEIYPVSHK